MKLNHVWGHKTRAEALCHARAEKTRHQLGRRWKIYIHHNMGWFWSFDNGPNVHVTPFALKGKIVGYTCLLGINHTGTYVGGGRTPLSAVRKVLANANKDIYKRQELANEARRVLNPFNGA